MKNEKSLFWHQGMSGSTCKVCGQTSYYGLEFEDGTGFDSEMVEFLCEEHYKKSTQQKRFRRLRKRIQRWDLLNNFRVASWSQIMKI